MKKLTNEEWRQKLTMEQYIVCREKGTERPFSGEYLYNDNAGQYQCVCCGALLFNAQDKFDSQCGWPAFSKVACDDDGILYITDLSHGMVRIEILCAQCDAHLGHVFEDSRSVTGKRYCLNSVALKFVGYKADTD